MLALAYSLACADTTADRPRGAAPLDTDSAVDSATDSAADTAADTASDSDTAPPPTGTATISAHPSNPFAMLVEVTTDRDAEVHVVYGQSALDRRTPSRLVRANTPTTIPVLGLRAGRSWRFRAAAEGWESEELAMRTDPLSTSWPVCTPSFLVDEAEFSPNEVVCSNARYGGWGHAYVCWDRSGQPVHAVRTPDDDSLFSMSPLPNGGFASTAYTSSKLLLFDDLGIQTAQYNVSWFSDTRFEHHYVDVHELTPITEGDWAGAVLFLTGVYDWFSDGSYKLGNGLIVYDPGSDEVLWDYSFHGELGDGVAMDPLLPYSRAGLGDYAEDWTHANSVLHGIDDEGDFFLISLKAQDWVVKLRPSTDRLEWALGPDGSFDFVQHIDGDLPEDRADWMYHQHGMSWVGREGSRMRVLMYDNGYPRQDESGIRWDLDYSRVVELELDEATARADLRYAYGETSGEDWFFSTSRGNAFLLPDGQRAMFLSGEQLRMAEVTYPGGQLRWAMQCPYDDEGMYRVRWAPDLYSLGWALGG